MKKWIIYLIMVIVLVCSSSASVWDYMTIGQADRTYCPIVDGCAAGNGSFTTGVNQSIINYVNQQNSTMKDYVDANGGGADTNTWNSTDDFFDSLIDGKVCVYNASSGDISCNETLSGVDTNTWNSTSDFTDTFVDRADWTTHDDYPAACSSGLFIIQIGDTVTCGYPTYNNSNEIRTAINNTNLKINYLNVTGNLDVSGLISSTDWSNVSITETQILNYAGNSTSDFNFLDVTDNTTLVTYITSINLLNNNSLLAYFLQQNTTITNRIDYDLNYSIYRRKMIGPEIEKNRNDFRLEGNTLSNNAITSGAFWYGDNRYVIPTYLPNKFNFTYWYLGGGANWVRINNVKVFNNTKYNQLGNTIVTIPEGYYGVTWLWVLPNGSFHAQYGINYYTYAEASALQTAGLGDYIPPVINESSLFIGKIISKKDYDFFVFVQPSETYDIWQNPIYSHGQLSGLTGDDHPQYLLRTEWIINNDTLKTWVTSKILLNNNSLLAYILQQNYTISDRFDFVENIAFKGNSTSDFNFLDVDDNTTLVNYITSTNLLNNNSLLTYLLKQNTTITERFEFNSNLFVNLTGDTMTGDLNMSKKDITTVDDIYLGDKLYHDGDINTFLGLGVDNFKFDAGGLTMFSCIEGGNNICEFNEDRADLEFRFHGRDLSYLLFLDGINKVGVGTSKPKSLLDVNGSVIINGTVNVQENITSNFIFANSSWNNIYNYPAACPEGSAITQLGDSVICTEFGGSGIVNNSDAVLQNLNIRNGNVTLAGKYFGVDTRNATIWNSQTGYGGIGGLKSVPVIINDDLNVTGNLTVTGNLYVGGCIRYNGGVLGTCI